MSGQELLPIAKELFSQMQTIAWMMLGPLFLLSCALCYMKEPTNFPALEMLHRIIVTIALLMFFPEITGIISQIANSLADKIGEHQALNTLFQKFLDQTKPENQTSHIPFLLNFDMGLLFLNYLSYAFVWVVKFLMVAIYHFYWALLMALAPMVILCNLFRGTAHITKSLFTALIEISTWNVVWQVMAVLLLGLNVVHPTPGNYFDAICFNFLVAFGMLGTPMLVHSLVRGSFAPASGFSAGAVVGIALGPVGQAVSAIGTTRQALKLASAAKQRFSRKSSKGTANG